MTKSPKTHNFSPYRVWRDPTLRSHCEVMHHGIFVRNAFPQTRDTDLSNGTNKPLANKTQIKPPGIWVQRCRQTCILNVPTMPYLLNLVPCDAVQTKPEKHVYLIKSLPMPDNKGDRPIHYRVCLYHCVCQTSFPMINLWLNVSRLTSNYILCQR